MTFIEQYHQQMVSGKITVCKRIRQVFDKLVHDLYNPKDNWVFDLEKGNDPITFIETFCKQSQGALGDMLELDLFQKAIIEATFGFIDKNTGYRKYNELLVIIGRKNGKTTLLAAINLYMTIADGEGSAENYIVATKLDQSMKCFNEVHNMVKQSKMLEKHIRKRKSDLYFSHTLSFIKALASNSNGLDGLNGHLVTIDELGAIKNRDLYDLMKQSMSARRQPLLCCISTNGFVRESIFDSQYEYACKLLDGEITDENFLPFIYELDSKDEWDNPSMWIKANPGLGTIKKYDFLHKCVEKAKNDPSFKATVMVKDFNMKENANTRWLHWDDLYNPTKFNFEEMNFNYGIGCFDLAETTDLASAKVLFMKRNDPNIYVKSMYWIPSETMHQKEKLDNIPYSLWEKQGLLRVSEGNKIDPYDMFKWFKEFREEHNIYISWIGYDPWHVDSSLLQTYESEFGKDAMIKVRQGVQTLSFPMKELKTDLQSDKIIYNDNPIDKWCLSNTEIKTDINNNIQPIKSADPRKRIDGAVSLIIGYVVLKNKLSEYEWMI